MACWPELFTKKEEKEKGSGMNSNPSGCNGV